MNGNGTGVVSRLSRFFQRPFTEEMDVWGWVLFTILVVTIGILWSRILAHITEG